MSKNNLLNTLLDLDEQIIEQDYGCWVKFEVKLVAVTQERPHGIRYSLTLHNKHGKRIMGFDNAHGVKAKARKSKYQGRKTYDHRHRHLDDEGVPYEFINALQLLEDFWLEVDKVLAIVKHEEGG